MKEMKQDTRAKTALISGGGQGIGFAIAQKFTEENIEVVVADKTVDKKHSWKEKKCDVGNPADIAKLYKWTKKIIGIPDILVISAGQGIHERLTEGDPEKWQEIMDVNLMGALRCIRAFVPEMVARKRGKVIVVSSVSAYTPYPYGGVYCASKTALEIIAETLRLECLPLVQVTIVRPGITDTDFFRKEISGNRTVETMGMGFISPEEIAEDVLYAISADSTCINLIMRRPIGQAF